MVHVSSTLKDLSVLPCYTVLSITQSRVHAEFIDTLLYYLYTGDQQVTASVWVLVTRNDHLLPPVHCQLHGTELR